MHERGDRAGGEEKQCRVVSLPPRMAKPGPMVKAEPEPSRNTVVAVAMVASVTHLAVPVKTGLNTSSVCSVGFATVYRDFDVVVLGCDALWTCRGLLTF
jgi:hypothetical protein